MPETTIAAVIGSGVIGRSWALVFARGGCRTHIYDAIPTQAARARAWVAETVALAVGHGLMTRAEAAEAEQRVTVCADLASALRGAVYVQESGPENLEQKQRMFVEVDRLADAQAIVATSTSTLNIHDIAAGLPGAYRCFVAHPVNPPHVIPAVEILPMPGAPEEVIDRACGFLRKVGQSPVRVKRYVVGFILNRLQAALVREAINIVQSGVADVDSVDATVRDGLGLRWAIMGPFGVANTNADEGIRQYYGRYGHAYLALMNDLGPTPAFDDAMIEALGRGVDEMTRTESQAEQLHRRDRLILAIRWLKAELASAKPTLSAGEGSG
ncbi:MAG: 3-hydroxyacyl-CoA dehydrogenase NAD-binding domain-containing protein [Terriglobales bacterium]